MFNQASYRIRGPIVAIALLLLAAPAFVTTAQAGGRFTISFGSGKSTRSAYAEGYRDGYRRGFVDGRDDARVERDSRRALLSLGRIRSAYREGFERGYERGYRIGFSSIDTHDRDDDDRDDRRHEEDDDE
jgi:hypothetical protein